MVHCLTEKNEFVVVFQAANFIVVVASTNHAFCRDYRQKVMFNLEQATAAKRSRRMTPFFL